jgi:hypothetical protein
MQPLCKGKKDKVRRYCCSNPNCKKVFSKPKVIKYYVCPSCQTVVDMTFENSKLIARGKKPILEKKLVAPRNQKEGNQDEKQQLVKSLRMQVSELVLELEAMTGQQLMSQPSTSQLSTDQQSTTDDELASMEKPEVKEIVEEEEQPTSQQVTADNELMLRKNPEVKEILETAELPQTEELDVLKAVTSQQATAHNELTVQKSETLVKAEETKQDENQELEEITRQQSTTDNELASMEKPEVKEIVEEEELSQTDEPNIVELKVNPQSGVRGSDYDSHFSLGVVGENGEAVKEQTGQSSDFKCSYYFGYLSQRDKAEVIPETCFGCLKSIECMMSEYHKTKESVEEIKKWYSFKL